MAMLVRSSPAPKFVVRASLALEHGSPPGRPPWRRGYGDYCWRATCEMRSADGTLTARVNGYDRYMTIQHSVEHACLIQARAMPNDGMACSPARVTLLHDYRKECAGQVYFVMDGSSPRRLL